MQTIHELYGCMPVMRVTIFLFGLCPVSALAGGPGGTPFHNELLPACIVFVGIMLLIVGSEGLVRWAPGKIRERKFRHREADRLAPPAG